MRICVGLMKLNKWVKRPYYPMRTPAQVLDRLPADAKYFCILDAKNGYFQLELDEESRPLTCFITTFGRYIFNRCPMGLCSAQDHYDKAGDEAIEV